MGMGTMNLGTRYAMILPTVLDNAGENAPSLYDNVGFLPNPNMDNKMRADLKPCKSTHSASTN